MSKKLEQRADERIAAAAIAAEVQRLVGGRPERNRLPSDIYMLALDGYENGNVPSKMLLTKCKQVADKIHTEVAGAMITVAHRHSLSASRSAAAVMVFHAALRQKEQFTFMMGVTDALIFRSGSFAHLCTIEPVGARHHLLERVALRSGNGSANISEIQEKLSTVWPALLELHQTRHRRGQRVDVTYFFSPLYNGLLFGNMSKVSGLPPGSNPQVIEFRRGQGALYDLPDMYASSNDRLFVHFRTYISPAMMKPHQVVLYEHLQAWVIRHQSVVDHLKLRGRLAVDVGSDGINDLMDIFGLEHPTPAAVDVALAELDTLILSAEWRREVAFSRRGRRPNEVLH